MLEEKNLYSGYSKSYTSKWRSYKLSEMTSLKKLRLGISWKPRPQADAIPTLKIHKSSDCKWINWNI